VRQKLLLADDSITIKKLVELILAEAGFEIKAVDNGEEASAVIPSFKPDLILADVEMPKVNGYQLCEQIKQDPSTAGIPVILLAGAFEQFDEELARKVGANDFVIKPFESQELINKVNAVLPISAEKEAAGVTAPEKKGVIAEEDLWAMEEILETPQVGAPSPEEETEPAEAGIVEVELPSKDELKEIFAKNVKDKIASLLSTVDIKGSISASLTTTMRDSISDIRESILASLVPQMKDSVVRIIGETISDLTEGVIRDTLKVSIEALLKRAENKIIETIPELTERILKDTLSVSLEPVIRAAEKIVSEKLPYLFEGMLKDELRNTFESMTKEVEKVIWKTIPDLAEAIISKEIERIRSEF
jgi:DNA-binding response OmpR family regulator